MSNTDPVGPIARGARVLTAFRLAVVVAALVQGQVKAAAPQAEAAQGTTTLHVEHSATTFGPEREFEEALGLRKRLTERDLRSAVGLLADSARQFASSGRPRQAAAAKLEAGDVYLMMSSYQQAIAAYHQALKMSGGLADQRCAALSRIARTYASIGRSHDAQNYMDEANSVCSAVSDKKVLADAAEAQGETRFWLGNMSEAIASFNGARKLATEAEDRDGEGLAKLMLSGAIDDPEERNRLAWSALADFVESGNEYGVAQVHSKLGYLASAAGNFEVARCHCESALPVFQRIADKDNAAIALNILGLIARQSGDTEQSLRYYKRARNDFASVRDDLGEFGTVYEIAEILLSQHKYSDLEPLYARKLHLAQATSNHAYLALALVDMADVYARQHQYLQAEKTYQRGLEEARVAGNPDAESTALERMAELQMELRRYRQALETFAKAQSLREQSGQIEDVARIQYSRARIYLQVNQLEDARTEIEKTIAIIESQRLRIAKFDSRAQYFASVHDYYSLYIQVLIALNKLHPDQNYARLAFEAAEKGKVRSLLDLLENTQQSVICDALLAHNSGAPTIKSNEATSEAQALSTTQPLTLNELETQIGDGDTVLLEYALGEDRSVAWVVDGKNTAAYDIAPAAEINKRVRMFRNALLPVETKANESPSDYLLRRAVAKRSRLTQAKLLANLLFGPLQLPPRKRLLIVPDGPLQYLPFAALAVPANGRESVPLIERYELTMLPSASTLVSLRKTASKRAPPADEVTVFADPAFAPPGKPVPPAGSISPGAPRSRELTRALIDVRDSRWIPSLPGSRNEALAIQQITGRARTRLIMGFDANREAIKTSSIEHQKILHFATHGMMDPRHPELSGLVLSMFNKKGEYQDGYLRVSDIYNLKLSADLVVLSSCESALGKDLGSEGINGLPRAFLYAGARTVIASLWKVDDDATVPLMKAFYSRLQRGETPALALREAQIEMLKSAQFSDPYYWAAFVLEGDYR